MKTLQTFALALLLAVGVAPASLSHSLKDLEKLLGSREKYFQPVDKPAPEFSLRSADGRPVTLASLHGKVAVLHFIYASCPDVCPLHAELVAEIQRMIGFTPMRDYVQFVSITTDPKNDTPDVMRGYGERHGLKPSNWVFLTTSSDQAEDTTRELAKRFGHKFLKTEDGYQTHGIVTHVIDQKGRIRANFHGLKFDPSNLVVFVNALLNDVAQPHGHGEKSLWSRIKRMFGS